MIYFSASVVAVLISTISCSEPPKTFREFYSHVTGASTAPYNGELVPNYVERLMDGAGHYLDYRSAYRDKCGAPR